MADLDRIKRNVAKMAAQNAPTADIDGYIASEGVSIEDVRNHKPEDKSGLINTIDAYGRGVAKMAMLGFGDEIGAAADYAGSHVLPWREAKTYDQALQDVRQGDRSLAEAHPVADAVGGLTGAVGLGAGMVRAGLSPTAKAINSGRGLAGVSVASGAEGAALGAIQGAGDAEGGATDRAAEAGYGALGGGLTGVALPSILQGAGYVAKRAISPFVSSPERMAAVSTLAREGVDTTAGQKTGSDALRYAEAEIGGRKAADMVDRQGEQFTRAALKRAGISANRATPDVIDSAFNTIGKKFDDLASRNQIVPDAKLARDLGDSVKEYFSLVPESQRAPIIMEMIRDIGARLSAGPLEGAAYQSARSRLDRLARSAARDPQLQQALYGIRNALDDGMQRSIAASKNTADLGAWQVARKQYRNLLTIEKASTAAGEKAAQGIISPSSLRNATVTSQGRRNYARGSGDFAALARAGESVMKPMPNSGTAGRLNAQNLGLGLAGLIGAGAGTATGDPMNALVGAGAGLMAPRMAGRVMMSPTMQKYLANQLATNVHWTPAQRAQVMEFLNITQGGEAPSFGRAILGAQ